ncbi:MAG: methionyl-tRNA formyltransferase [Campylobacteraceae bacterium]|jgi:methionyl-tRNA formyltransferase|nr:methionyl-tRNA formyltransferase [Campylobacteraceae bacterium]
MKKYRIIFMGTPHYATTIFKSLIESCDMNVCAVFTQPDKKVGRGQILSSPHIKQFTQNNNLKLDIFQPESIKDNNTAEYITSLKPDFIIVAAYGKILPESILQIAPCINLHASLLPKYRGASPIQQAILNNDKYSGVTAMKMAKGLDTGEILGFSYVKIENLNSDELFELLSKKAAALTLKVIRSYENILHVKQSDVLSSKTSKITKEDGKINFNLTCKELKQKSLAYTSWPGVFLPNGLKLKSFECEKINHDSNMGIITQISQKDVVVTCADGYVKLSRVAAPSKQETDAFSYVNGKRIKVGDTFY